MAEDILIKYPARLFEKFYSTPERRVVLLNKGTCARVVGDGSFLVPLPPRSFDEVALFNMGPFIWQVPFSKGVRSNDGIEFNGELSITIVCPDTIEAISVVVTNLNEQLRIASLNAIAEVQNIMRTWTYSDVNLKLAEFATQLSLNLRTASTGNSNCLRIIEARILSFEPVDKAVAEARLREIQTIREQELAITRAKYEAQKAEEALRIEKNKAQQGIELEIAALRIAEEKAKLVSTEAGILALDLKAGLEHKAKELEVKALMAQLNDKQQRDILRALVGFQSGRNDVLATLAANQFGIKLSEGPQIAALAAGGKEDASESNMQPSNGMEKETPIAGTTNSAPDPKSKDEA